MTLLKTDLNKNEVINHLPFGLTCIGAAILREQYQTVAKTLDTSNVNDQDIYGNTAAHYALVQHNIKIINIVMSCPNCDMTVQNNHGETPNDVTITRCLHFDCFHVCVCRDCPKKKFHDLLDSIPTTCKLYDTLPALDLLSKAILKNHEKAIMYLIYQTNIDVANIDLYGNTAFHYAAYCGNRELIKIMLQHTDLPTMSQANYAGCTPCNILKTKMMDVTDKNHLTRKTFMRVYD